MFMQPLPNAAPGISRPFVVAVVLLLLFLSTQTDWSPPQKGSPGKRDRELQAEAPAALSKEGTKERVSTPMVLPVILYPCHCPEQEDDFALAGIQIHNPAVFCRRPLQFCWCCHPSASTSSIKVPQRYDSPPPMQAWVLGGALIWGCVRAWCRSSLT